MICLDTDFLIALLHGVPAAVEKAKVLDTSGEVRCTTPINMFELYLGACLSKKSTENIREVGGLLSSLVHLTYDEEAARAAGELGAKLELMGAPVKLGDIMIAGIAKRHNCPVLTRDEHFSIIEGLKVESW
jgi:predicted nucleic acid-binding protein